MDRKKTEFVPHKIFECKAFTCINNHKKRKLDKTIERIFLEYENRSKGHAIYDSRKNITISRTVIFSENIHPNAKDKDNTNRKINSAESKNAQVQNSGKGMNAQWEKDLPHNDDPARYNQ